MLTGALAGFAGLTGITVFTVYKRITTVNYGGIFSLWGGSGLDYNSQNGMTVQNSTGPNYAVNYGGAGSTVNEFGVGFQVGEAYIITAASTTAQINGGAPVTSSSGLYPSMSATQAAIGCRLVTSPPSYYANIDLAAVLVYNSNLSSASRSSIRVYLGSKYGVTVTP